MSVRMGEQMSSSTGHPAEVVAEVDEATAILVHADAIRLLERALARVTVGYFSAAFYRRTWFRRRPQFCMCGALTYTDDGHYEGYSDAHWLAEKFAMDAIDGRTLISYGTRPFVKHLVKRAYRRALAAARENSSQG